MSQALNLRLQTQDEEKKIDLPNKQRFENVELYVFSLLCLVLSKMK